MDSFPFSVIAAESHRTTARGFTLIEMIVVLAIIGLITGIVVSGQSAYNDTLLLNDTAYTIALSVRQAQSLGLSSRNFGSAGTGQNVGYGVHLSRGALDRYTIFADTSNAGLSRPSACVVGTPGTPEWKPGNCRYTGVDGIVQTYTFSRNYRFSKFCGKSGSGQLQCSNTNNLAALDIVFMRPNTVSVLTGTRSGGQAQAYTCVELHLSAPTGNAERVIRVSQLGEVSIGQTCP